MERLALLFAAVALAASGTDSASAKRKIQLIQQDRVPPGTRVTLNHNELNAYVREQVAAVAPAGVRDPRVVLGPSRATGYAYLDFPKLRQAQGKPMNPLLAWLVGGERPIRVDAHIRSGGGKAVVNIERLEISGIVLSGATLDWLIRNFLWSYYPEAKLGKPFELGHRIDRLEIEPSEVRVVIGR
ncbi:MAG: hypothetical protein ABSH05_08465 [Bryobacteraceae bacterium]|jgi:hypothetical protein